MSGADWHVLIKTQNGKVSILRNLTKEAADAVMVRLNPYREFNEYVTAERKRREGLPVPAGGWPQISWGRHANDSDIVTLELLGPSQPPASD